MRLLRGSRLGAAGVSWGSRQPLGDLGGFLEFLGAAFFRVSSRVGSRRRVVRALSRAELRMFEYVGGILLEIGLHLGCSSTLCRQTEAKSRGSRDHIRNKLDPLAVFLATCCKQTHETSEGSLTNPKP